jgi:Glycine zipper
MKKSFIQTFALSAGLALLLAPAVRAQNVFVYPAKGQSAEQTDRDKYDCFNWAKQQTGFDPSQPTQVASSSSSSKSDGQIVKGAAGGAAIGAVGGAIAGDAGKGAAIGAASGALLGGIKKRKNKKEEQQELQQQQAAASGARAAYDRAYKACLEAKGYSVQ